MCEIFMSCARPFAPANPAGHSSMAFRLPPRNEKSMLTTKRANGPIYCATGEHALAFICPLLTQWLARRSGGCCARDMTAGVGRADAAVLGRRNAPSMIVERAKERSDMPAAAQEGGHASLCAPTVRAPFVLIFQSPRAFAAISASAPPRIAHSTWAKMPHERPHHAKLTHKHHCQERTSISQQRSAGTLRCLSRAVRARRVKQRQTMRVCVARSVCVALA